mmetsp:Transcript_8278/g.9384  ORF Transcript_8278/g.9384 Transcript_8278/m.9384 type:complete len:325 (-) Transcript_8278:1053-2027(-)|eukprot:CAMPEP_0204849682 /NCGR_PEP_ID=MMETSP1347-20130617/6707_1 /ASSEMBLY_ACC=CAM_ASM_000690 /TAXON_ID=215587 /ORGANISM="Aplanochytrium stocchinoi, Strain GSBS06" /LENGTH=324 /DNA_ID=CAMNT_0051992147 /DNA_START=147 /DNA_END=1121 /DNA_ORIENTATION=-
MLKLISFAALLMCAYGDSENYSSKYKKLDWCVYPYGPKDYKGPGFVLVETNEGNKGINWWTPVAKWSHEDNYYRGLKAELYLDDKYVVKGVEVHGYLSMEEESQDYDKYGLELSKFWLKSYDPVTIDQCFCTSKGADNPKFYKNKECDQDIWEKNTIEPKKEYGDIFDPKDAIYNCPKCERSLCDKERDAYNEWTFFKKTEGWIESLKGKKCEIYVDNGPLAQIGVRGANGKNEYFGYAVWLRCDKDGYVKQYDLHFNVGPCCKYKADDNVPKDEKELKVLFNDFCRGDYDDYFFNYQLKDTTSYLQQQIASRLRHEIAGGRPE